MKTVKTKRGYEIKCPGCNGSHTLDNRWTFNGDVNQPTFNPSLHIRLGPWPEGSKRAGKIDICHSFIRSGSIEYLSDCTHSMRGTTVDLPDYTDDEITVMRSHDSAEE